MIRSVAEFDRDAVVAFYFGEGGKSKEGTAKKFGITPWWVCKALVMAGHSEEVAPTWLTTIQQSIQPGPLARIAVQHKAMLEGNDGHLPGCPVGLLAVMGRSADEYHQLLVYISTLEGMIKEKSQHNARLQKILVELQTELSKPQ